MYDIPTRVKIDGQSYAIQNQGDYRMVLDCFVALNDTELTEEERIFASLIIFYKKFKKLSDLNKVNIKEAVRQMFLFFNCGNDFEDERKLPKLINWEKDSQIISSAINKVSGQEIRNIPYMHWWTFMGYYLSIGQSVLSQVVGIRYKLSRGEKLEKWERKFQQDNPQYFKVDLRTAEQKENDEFIKNLRDEWNNEG